MAATTGDKGHALTLKAGIDGEGSNGAGLPYMFHGKPYPLDRVVVSWAIPNIYA